MSTDPNAEQWSYKHVGAYRVWNYTVGSRDVVVAIVDNGFDEGHHELADNVWHNPDEVPNNGVDDDQNGFVDDVTGWDFTAADRNRDGRIDDLEFLGDNNPNPDTLAADAPAPDLAITHGTAVASIIGAIGDNGRDGAGVAWRVQLMNIRAADNEGVGAVQPIVQGIRYAVDNGASVVNVSMSVLDGENFRGVLQYAYDHGVAVFAAAGNLAWDLNKTQGYPACGDAGSLVQFVLGVSATDIEHHLARFSNFGRNCIDLAAPGAGINGAVSFGGYTYGSGWQGTSFAVPFVSGAAALVKAVRPQWQAPDIYRALLTTVRHTCTDREAGYPDLFGKGELQIDRAVRIALAGPRVGGAVSWNERLIPHELWTLDGTTGQATAYDVVTSTPGTHSPIIGTSREVPQLARSLLVRQYQRFPCTRFTLAINQGTKNNDRVIAVYDKNMQVVGRWNLPEVGAITATLVDTAGAGQPLVAVAPTVAAKSGVRWFTLTGEPAGEWKLPRGHRGVELATLPTPTGDRLVASISGKKDTTVALYESATTTVSFKVQAFGNHPQLVTGDVDGNGRAEIVLVGGGAAPIIGYYSAEGEMRLQFAARAVGSGSDKKFPWHIGVGDYFADGRDEIILYPTKGTGAGQVFDGHGDLVDTPTLTFGTNSSRALLWQ